MSKKLLRCTDCNRLLLLGPHNRAPSYRFQGHDLEPIELHCDDEASFRRRHAGHEMDEISVVPGSYVSTGPWGDPMRESFFEAKLGQHTLVVRRWRNRLDRPVIYEVVPGTLEVRTVSIEVQRPDLERQLEADLRDSLHPGILERFVKAVEEVAGNLDYDDLEEVCVDRKDPLVAYLRMNDKHVAEILDRLGSEVPVEIIRKLHDFIRKNSEADDVMNLAARKAFAVRNPQAIEPSTAGS